jgi:hypothetical protein
LASALRRAAPWLRAGACAVAAIAPVGLLTRSIVHRSYAPALDSLTWLAERGRDAVGVSVFVFIALALLGFWLEIRDRHRAS